MPLVETSGLPSFRRLRDEGQEVLALDRARTQDIRELHIGLLNMMPDAALEATERQFMRLVGSCNRIAQFFIHPFSFPEIPREASAAEHIRKHYTTFGEIRERGLDALILSGANPALPDITAEQYWKPLEEVVHWAKDNVCSVMCSCLATHAIVQMLYGFERYALPQKRWGVYSHRLTGRPHPITWNIDSRFDAPHSHVYEVNSRQFAEAGLVVLAEGEVSDLHLGVSPDGLRFIFFQGHPEYDKISLLKEYKREVVRYIVGIRPDYPPFPEHYFHGEALEIAEAFRADVLARAGDYETLRAFPDAELEQTVDITWSDTGKAMINNWLGLVYQVAHRDRGRVFMEGVDPSDPLGLVAKGWLSLGTAG
ncbi:MAG: homoserine O-succinyltransferase [Gammaproteobacteria bacterium]|nr:homoserine O-succinyltransferase [Gammaproteobacteria bacterium]MYD75172.1 homoserine O-succinyltransferase [Gammaproteobacteria bacterium]MYJ51569.1 homoserine O-succinyltransferase [Gammaproteobacteria bacterium]